MSFIKKIKNKNLEPLVKNKPFYKRRGWKIFFSILAIFIIVGTALAFYVLSSGSKMFENGLSGISLVKSIVGSGDTLKGEDRDRINILLTGMGGGNHPGAYLTDSIMVVSIQPKEKKIAMLSIPRDLLVPIKGHNQDKINAAFSDGYSDYSNKNCSGKNNTGQCKKQALAAGASLSDQTVSDVIGQPIDYHINVEFSGFEKIIDDLGGIDINVDKAIYDPMYPAYDNGPYATFKISAGQHHMDGATTLKYARSRETTSDFDRAARQQKILLAVKKKAADTNFLSNPSELINVFNSLTDSVHTNLSPTEIKSFVSIIKNVDTSTAVSKVLTTGADGQLVDYNDGTYYLKPKTGNFKQIQDIAANIFNQKKDVSVQISNGGKLSTTQVDTAISELKKDSKANFTVTSAAATKTTVSQTTIYDYTDGTKSDILQYLKQKYNAAVIDKTGTTSDIDFYIVLGTSFSK